MDEKRRKNIYKNSKMKMKKQGNTQTTLREKRDVAESEIKRVVVLPTNGRRRQAKPSTRKKGNYCFLGCFPNFIFEKKKNTKIKKKLN